MKLRLRHLRLRATTTTGMYGADLQFSDGLVVVRGRNTSGKSTLMKGILYALGMEGMLSPRKAPPFPEVMTSRLQGAIGEVDVLESSVGLEIENEDGRRVVCLRAAKGNQGESDIIRVAEGGVLSTPGATYSTTSYFVRLPGAATRDAGFHKFLAEFIGWKLPLVPKYDGDPSLLYMECIFPFLFVEQITGWRGIVARMPTWLGIPDVWQRSIEYLLALDRSDLPLRRFSVERKRKELQAQWQSAIETSRIEVHGLGTIAKDVPPEPVATWPPTTIPTLVVVSGPDWAPIEVVLTQARDRLRSLVEQEIPQVQHVAADLAAAVQRTQEHLAKEDVKQAALAMATRSEQEYLDSLAARLDQLEEDLRKNQDELTLRKRGALGDPGITSRECPVCRRPRTDSLLDQGVDFSPMPIEANIAHIKAEIGLFEELRADQSDVIASIGQRFSASRQTMTDLESLFREQRRALRSDGQLPSSAAIRERLVAEDEVRRLEIAGTRFQELLSMFETLAGEWRHNETARSAIKDGSPTEADNAKRSLIDASFKSQLLEYGFSSFGEESFNAIQVDPFTYRPTKDGFDIGEMSASDTIRCVWAYLLSLLECARVHETNHVGLLLFDEPRQQSADKASFAALIRRAASAGVAGQQVIFATSEESPELVQAMKDTYANVIELPAKVVQPVA
jgi:hypothetical protein